MYSLSRVGILNDFEAVGYGIPMLEDSDIVPINSTASEPLVSLIFAARNILGYHLSKTKRKKFIPKAPKVVMGPGTGLGAAQLMWDEGQNSYKVWPGEDKVWPDQESTIRLMMNLSGPSAGHYYPFICNSVTQARGPMPPFPLEVGSR